ncbi:hypothetical protein Nepgr_029321 [Nepenthes gracilis]|uniref:Uncharacterized protein n=1 Tax=Nepenthes gracilis TaxID=150966 RepID=A0AAD3Y361_NEPGR|nr:hypothetical protein Nepgr_029321 [Nepenthes gracilis]
MGKADEERLNRALNSHLSDIHETYQILDQTPDSSLEKVGWDEVIKMGEQLSKQATMAGMLWTREKPEVKALEENMVAYFNKLQGLLLLSHGSTVGAGPTLSSNIHASIKQVVDCSFILWRESVSLYGSRNRKQKLTLPQLVGTIWDACSALKKTPTTNITAIGRAMTQVAVTMKDVLREMKELKPCSSGSTEEAESQLKEGDDSSDGDIETNLSPEEMEIAHLAAEVVSEMLSVVKELIRSITGLLKRDNLGKNGDGIVNLEKLLKLCEGAGVEADELGASLYPPQEFTIIIAATRKICSLINEMQRELDGIDGSTAAFLQACCGLKSAVDMLLLRTAETENSSTGNLVPQMHNLSPKN